VEEKVEGVVSERLIAAAQHSVVEQIRQGGERPIQAGFSDGPPVGVTKNQLKVGAGCGAEARVKKKAFVIENEAGLEGIRKRSERDDRESDGDKKITGRGNRRNNRLYRSLPGTSRF
jgi:hypothetical protein